MTINRFESLQNRLPPLLVLFALLGLYLRTLAPSLTWAHGGSDGGDLVSAAATGGVAHPTGYPLYLLLARLFQSLPVGSLAFRTNLMSAVAMSLAAALLTVLVMRAIRTAPGRLEWPAGLAAGFAFGSAPLVWSQAVITEVYALQAFLTVLILYIYTQPVQNSSSSRKYLDLFRGLVLGLAMSNHVTALLLAPAALVLGCIRRQAAVDGGAPTGKRGFDVAALGRQLLGFIAGLSLYLSLPLRALANPPINWGNAVTPERLWWLASGRLYQSHYLQVNLPETWERIQAGAALLLQQFGLPGIVLGLFGLIVFGVRSRLYFLTAWLAAANTLWALLYRSGDSYVYLIPLCMSFAIWLGLALAGLTQPVLRRSLRFRVWLGLLVLGYFAVRPAFLVNQMDASRDLRAETFAGEILAAAPEQAILFAKGDQAVFTLWYYHFALGQRSDLAVLAVDLLHFDWYQENLRSTYPSLSIPGPYPWPETISQANISRAVCYVQYAESAEVNCSRPPTPP